jgi:hypothetical protein
MTTDRICVFQILGEGQCWRLADASGYCAAHVKESPEEIRAHETLISQIQTAKRTLDEIGEQILKSHVVWGDDPVPIELRREYRNAWYRWNYLTNVHNTRRPGSPLPAEVTMRAPD